MPRPCDWSLRIALPFVSLRRDCQEKLQVRADIPQQLCRHHLVEHNSYQLQWPPEAISAFGFEAYIALQLHLQACRHSIVYWPDRRKAEGRRDYSEFLFAVLLALQEVCSADDRNLRDQYSLATTSDRLR